MAHIEAVFCLDVELKILKNIIQILIEPILKALPIGEVTVLKIFNTIRTTLVCIILLFADSNNAISANMEPHEWSAVKPVFKNGIWTMTIKPKKCLDTDYGDGRAEKEMIAYFNVSKIEDLTQEQLDEIFVYSEEEEEECDDWIGVALRSLLQQVEGY